MEANLVDLTSSRGIDKEEEQEMREVTKMGVFCSNTAREQKTKITTEDWGLIRSRKGLTRSRKRNGAT